MIKIEPDYRTVGELEEEWGCITSDIFNRASQGLLKIWETDNLRLRQASKPISKEKADEIFRTLTLDGDDLFDHQELGFKPQEFCYMTGIDYAIKDKEFHRFEQKHGIIPAIAEGYPPELKIAVEVWSRVFAYGLKLQSPPQNQHDMVRGELKPYNLADHTIERIRYILVGDKSKALVTESTTSDHNRNEEGHIYYSRLLEIAIKLWSECKSLNSKKKKTWLELFYEDLGTREVTALLKLINPKPQGGRPKKSV